MKWIKWQQPGAVVQQYHLMEGNTLLETVRFQPLQQSARISCAEQQRVFFIKDPAKKMSGYSIENEYGFAEGAIRVEGRTGNEMVCSITLGELQFHFTLHYPHTPQEELVSFHAAHTKSICCLPADPAGTWLRRVPAISLTNLHAALIWSLHWWLLMGKPRKDNEGDLSLPLRGAKIFLY